MGNSSHSTGQKLFSSRDKIREKLVRLLDQDPASLSAEALSMAGTALILERIERGIQMVSPDARDIFGDVVAFHKKYGIAYQGNPRRLPMGLRSFRYNRLKEEMTEYILAFEQDLQTEQFDGLIDLIYIALGTIHLHGWDFYRGWSRVHSANMAKTRASEKHPGKYGNPLGDDNAPCDIVKPPGWTAPDLSDLVCNQR